MKDNFYRQLRRECGIACMNLNSKTDCIMLTMLERMRLTCCVLPQGKALNVPCIVVYAMYRLPNIQLALMLINLRISFG